MTILNRDVKTFRFVGGHITYVYVLDFWLSVSFRNCDVAVYKTKKISCLIKGIIILPHS